MICTSIALVSRSAIEGGLPPETAYALSDIYLQRLEKCKVYVSQNLNTAFTLDDLAHSININKNYLSRLFSQEEGLSIMKYAQRERIKTATIFVPGARFFSL